MQKITPFLWFDGVAEEAVNHYLSIFKGGEVLSTTPGPGGKPLVLTFRLEGQEFIALNGGPMFKFTEAMSPVTPRPSSTPCGTAWAKAASPAAAAGSRIATASRGRSSRASSASSCSIATPRAPSGSCRPCWR